MIGGSDLERMLASCHGSYFYRLMSRAAAHERAAEHGATKTLRTAHYHAFLRWLCLKLEQQSADLEQVLSAQSACEQALLVRWLRAGGYTALIPDCALRHERDLFATDLQTVVELITTDPASG